MKVVVYSHAECMTETVSSKPSDSRACVQSRSTHDRDGVIQNHLVLEPV